MSTNKRESSLTARAAVLMFAKTLGFVFSFAVPLVLARRLAQTEYGLYKQSFLIISTSLFLLPMGVQVSAYYYLPREPERRQQVVFNILLFNLTVGGLACLALILRPDILARLFHSEQMIAFAPYIGLIVLTWVVSSFLEVVAVANQEVKLATLLVICAQFTKAAFLLAAALLYASVWAVLLAALAQGVLQTLILFAYLSSRFKGFWRGFEWAMMRRQLSYALPLGAAAVLLGLQWNLDNYFVSYWFSPALYAIYINGCFQLPLDDILNSSIGSVMIPRVSELQKEGRAREIIALLARMTRKLAALYFPIYVFLLINAREFILILFTQKYAASWPIFAINLLLIPLSIVMTATDSVMRAYAEHRYFLLRLRITTLCLLFVSLWFFTSHYGLIGSISAMVGVNCIERIATAAKSASILGMNWRDVKFFKDLWKLAASAALAGVATLLARRLMPELPPLPTFILSGLVFSPVYLLLVLAFRVPTSDEKEAVRGRIVRLPRMAAWGMK